jgi:hypothetical protein
LIQSIVNTNYKAKTLIMLHCRLSVVIGLLLMVGIHGKNDTAAAALPDSTQNATTSDAITNMSAAAVNDKNSSDWKMLKDPMAPYEPSRHLRSVKDDSRPAPQPPARPAPAPAIPLSFLPWHPITPPLCPPKNETARYLLRYMSTPRGSARTIGAYSCTSPASVSYPCARAVSALFALAAPVF